MKAIMRYANVEIKGLIYDEDAGILSDGLAVIEYYDANTGELLISETVPAGKVIVEEEFYE